MPTLGTLTGVGATFTPKAIAGCKGWWRSDLSTVWVTTVGGTAAVNDGDLVGAWADLSGNNNTFSATVKPTLKLNMVNGMAAVRFTGTQYMTAASTGFGGTTTPKTMFLVMQTTSVAAGEDYLTLSNTTSANQYSRLQFGATGSVNNAVLRNDANSPAILIVGGTARDNTVYHIHMDTVDTSANIALYRDGGAASGTGAYGGTTFTWNNICLMALNRNSVSSFGTADVAEVIAYNRKLNAAEVNAVQYYLNQRYQLSAARF